ncbi:MAG: hypothetical protein M0Q51_16160 [Bacteroidales bacterium]|nr:hypothetical protein [Bacteroidales bacterium]
MKDGMLNIIEDTLLQSLSDPERELNNLFRENDKELELSRIYLGAVRVYKDNSNPDKNTLVSHSVREINRILPKKYPISVYAISNASDGVDMEKEVRNIVVNSFNRLPMLNDSEVNLIVEKWSGCYKPNHRQQFKQMLISIDEEQSLPMTIVNKIDETLSELIKLNKWFTGYAHQGNRSEMHLFDGKWQLIQDVWRNILSPFYGVTDEIDGIISVEIPNDKLFKSLLSKLIRQKLVEYLFRTLDKPGWFDFLNENEFFLYAPEIEKDEDDNTIQAPPWWPGYYLLKVADKIPEKITPLLEQLKINDNWNALDLCFQITLKLPFDYSKQLLPKIDEWLDSSAFQIADKYAMDLLGKFIDEEHYNAALQLFDILSKPVKKAKTSTSLRSDIYYSEELKQMYLPALIQNKPEEVLEIVEKRLNEAIKLSRNEEDDYSYIWRPSIVESEENALDGDAENIYVEILRDALLNYYKHNNKSAKTKIEEYLNKKYSIYKRLAIYIIDACDISECYEPVLTNKKFLGSYEMSREYFVLLRNKYALLDINIKKKILELIESGPGEGEEPEQVKQWIEKRLYKIGDIVLQDEKLKEYHQFINKYKRGIDAAEKEAEEDRAFSRGGPTSPKTIEELKQMKPGDFIDYIRNDFKPAGGFGKPTPEGLASLLRGVVKENPIQYAEIAEKFAEDGICPVYPAYLLQALHDAWREGKDFEWESVIKLCELMLDKNDPEGAKDVRDRFDYGLFSWVKGSIADLLGEAVRSDKHVIDDDYLPRIKHILFYLAEKDSNPETRVARWMEHQGERIEIVDYVAEAINCNRGKALEAVILYALRIARIKEKSETKKAEGPFPPGHRLEDDVKIFLENRMRDEPQPSVHSTFGRYFQYLFYLDQEWVKEKIKQGLLFSKGEDKTTFWDADWQGYVLFNRFYDDLYGLLKENGDYKKAIDRIKAKSIEDVKNNQEGRNLALHIMLAYLRGLESLEKQGNLVKYFFDNTPAEVRSQAIWALHSLFEKRPPTNDDWPKLRKLWEYRAEATDDEELGAFVAWLKWPLPESIRDLSLLIKKSINCKGKVFHQHGYYEYYIKNIEAYPSEVLGLTDALLKASHKNKPLYYGYQKYVKQILDAVQPKALEHKDIVNSIVNFLGEVGDYSFKEYLIK